MAKTRSNDGAPEAATVSRTKPRRRSLSKSAFSRIFEDGRRQTGEYCRIATLPGEGRFGVSTPKSIGCHARRNRLKRRFKEAFRLELPNRASAFDVVVLANAAADSVEFVKLRTDLRETLETALDRWDES